MGADVLQCTPKAKSCLATGHSQKLANLVPSLFKQSVSEHQANFGVVALQYLVDPDPEVDFFLPIWCAGSETTLDLMTKPAEFDSSFPGFRRSDRMHRCDTAQPHKRTNLIMILEVRRYPVGDVVCGFPSSIRITASP